MLTSIELNVSISLGLFLLIFGLIWGSFLNSFIYRTKNNIPLGNQRSFCPKCKENIAWYDNIPLLSFIFLKGKCRKCKQKISFQYPIIEVLIGVLSLLVGFITLPFPFSNIYLVDNPVNYLLKFLFFFALAFLLLYFCIYDILYFEINDKVAISLIVVLLILNLIAIKYPFSLHTSIFVMNFGLDNILSGIIGLILIAAIILISKGKMGGGDLRYIIIVGLISGLENFYLTFLSSVVIGSIVGLIYAFFKKRFKGLELPFIPFLTVGIIVGLIWGHIFWQRLFFYW